MNESNAIILIIGSLIGLVIYQRNKAKSAEALADNLKANEKLNDLNKDIIKNKALMEAEEEKRKAIENEANEKKKQKLSLQDISDMFNKLNDRK